MLKRAELLFGRGVGSASSLHEAGSVTDCMISEPIGRDIPKPLDFHQVTIRSD